MISEQCIYCKRFITKNNFERHSLSCKNKAPKVAKIRGVDFDPNAGYKDGSRVVWNKGLTKDSDSRINDFSKNHPNKGKRFGTSLNGQGLEQRKHLSVMAKKNNLGGHTSKNSMYYEKLDGSIVYLHSSYEINLAKILDSLNIKWERPKPFKWVDDNNEDHKYYPDFEVNGIYIDTKNDYLLVVDARKIELVRQQNKIDLRVLSKREINIDFVKNMLVMPS